MRQLLLHNIFRQFSKTGMMYVTFMMAIGYVFFLKMCIFVLVNFSYGIMKAK